MPLPNESSLLTNNKEVNTDSEEYGKNIKLGNNGDIVPVNDVELDNNNNNNDIKDLDEGLMKLARGGLLREILVDGNPKLNRLTILDKNVVFIPILRMIGYMSLIDDHSKVFLNDCKTIMGETLNYKIETVNEIVELVLVLKRPLDRLYDLFVKDRRIPEFFKDYNQFIPILRKSTFTC